PGPRPHRPRRRTHAPPRARGRPPLLRGGRGPAAPAAREPFPAGSPARARLGPASHGGAARLRRRLPVLAARLAGPRRDASPPRLRVSRHRLLERFRGLGAAAPESECRRRPRPRRPLLRAANPPAPTAPLLAAAAARRPRAFRRPRLPHRPPSRG